MPIICIALLSATATYASAGADAGRDLTDSADIFGLGAGTVPTERSVALPDPEELVPRAPGSDDIVAFTACSFTDGGGSSNTELYGFYTPYGSGGWTDPNEGNNIYIQFNQCRSTFTDPSGNRYAFLVYKETQNAGSNNHVGSWWDYGEGKPTERLEMTPGAGQTIVDYDPVGHTNHGGGTLNLGLAYGGASVSWSQSFPDVDIYEEYHTGAKTRWRTEENSFGYHGQSVFTSTYGITQAAAAGTSAQHNWWFEDRFHHYECSTCSNNWVTRYSAPCDTPGCGYNTFYTPLGS